MSIKSLINVNRMPTYEYECPKCNKRIELVQSMKDRIAPLCTNDNCCIEMVQVISVSNFILKGSGWANDGYSGTKK